MSTNPSTGDHLRDWRRRRRMSQLDLALAAEISQRHLSFIESGRSRPSRDMLMRLAERLEIPLRARNPLLVAAGFAPAFAELRLVENEAAPALAAVETILAAHDPYPALAVDRHWTMVSANGAVAALLTGIADKSLLAPPVNVLRLSLSPNGLAPLILNYSEWRHHLLERLHRQVEASGDHVVAELLEELKALPKPYAARPQNPATGNELFVPLRLRSSAGELALISMTTVFGAPLDVGLSELALETFLPADAETAERLRAIAEGRSTSNPAESPQTGTGG